MVKRQRDIEESDSGSVRSLKRIKSSSIDHFTSLSDELILRVLSYLPVSQLVVCQRLSHKFQSLAGDSQLWKEQYYNRFVRPRASRLPGLKDRGDVNEKLSFTSKASRWLDDEHLVDRKVKTNWKRQYKLRHNWSRGSCAVNEIAVAENAVVPPVLVQMQDGVIYMASQTDGLRAWSARGDRKLIAHLPLRSTVSSRPPTALATDPAGGESGVSSIVVGFEDGSFSVFVLKHAESQLYHRYSHEPSSRGVISAVAISWPYTVTMTATHLLSLYRFNGPRGDVKEGTISKPPLLLHSLKSHTVWPPLSISLRTCASSVTISVAYALPTYLSGWTVGIQEIKVSPAGHLLESRLASAIDQHYRPLAFSAPPMMHHLNSPGSGSLATSTTSELRHIHSKPTSLSYTHPYLLVSHPDNTLTLYLVSSTTDSLTISAGSRLWGHTSSVSGAHVAGRGKAVSVSKRGDELRVWELEGGFASSAARKRLVTGDISVQVRPDAKAALTKAISQRGLDLVDGAVVNGNARTSQNTEEDHELTLTRGWIGFDEENVVVLKEQSQGRQALVVYDFT